MYLNCHTGFSFKYGTLPIEALFDEAKRCGVRKLALTEINNTASYLEMLRICEKNRYHKNGLTKFGKEPYNLDIAVGVEFRNEDQLLYVAVAKNNIGFEIINRFLSYKNREDTSFPMRAPDWEDVFTIYPFGKIDPGILRDHEYIGVGKQDLHHYSICSGRQEYIQKFVALHPVTFLSPENKNGKLVYKDHSAHRLLRCMAHNTLLSKLAEHQQARRDEFMLPESELKKRFERYPELIDHAESLLDQCSIGCRQNEDKNKKYFTGNKKDDSELLQRETVKGFKRRYGNIPKKTKKGRNKEKKRKKTG